MKHYLKSFNFFLFFTSAKRFKSMKIIVVCLLFPAFIYSQDTIDRGNYFIAISHDGNMHDKDDFIASALNIALLKEVDLWDKVLHFDYSNHIWDENINSVVEMQISVKGACEKWMVDTSKVFEVRIKEKLEAAKENFKQAAQTAKDHGAILYYACGGPMEVPYQFIENLSPELRKVVCVISHSKWNNEHAGKKHGGRNWDDLIKIAGDYRLIANQNQHYFNNLPENWKWLEAMGGRYAWLYSRNPFVEKFDPSDVGLTYYIITGRGNDRPKREDVEPLFKGMVGK
jgi:hypothetical protein